MLKAQLKQLDALNQLIEAKLTRIGEVSVKIQMCKNDLGDTESSLDDNTKFFGDLKRDCSKKTAEYEERCKMRAMELAALADTIKVLNDDDALDLFKKTLPSASLLQVQVRLSELRRRALAKLRGLAHSAGVQARPQLDFIALALSGKKIGFGKIIKMIDNMIATLKQEQADDDSKMEYCSAQLDTADDKKKALERTVSDLESQIASLKEAIITVTGEIDALEDGIRALDKSVAEATENRKEEYEEYAELMASDGAAKELILYAKNRMQKFYNPKLYKAPPKRELTEEERITLNNGGTLAPTAPPAGIAGTGIAVFAQVAMTAPPTAMLGGCASTLHGCCPGSDQAASGPNGEGCGSESSAEIHGDGTTTETMTVSIEMEGGGGGGGGGAGGHSTGLDVDGHSTGLVVPTASPDDLPGTVDVKPAPKTWEGGYKKQNSGGALALMDLLVKDLQKEMTEASAEEENSQKDYETFMKDSATKRAEDSKTVTDKTAAKAEMRGELESATEAKASAERSLAGTLAYIHSLHTECDWLMKYYTVRKEARASETDALANAKAVLSGADFSFLQARVASKPGHLRGQQ